MKPHSEAAQDDRKRFGKTGTWGTIVILILAATISRTCHEIRQPERKNKVVTILIPIPLGKSGVVNGGYSSVKILETRPGYVKFRTADGTVIEHSGAFQILHDRETAD